MDPNAMDFVMHSSPSDPTAFTPPNIDQQHQSHSRCPAMRAAADQSQHPGMHSPTRGGGSSYYDPVHGSSSSGSWYPQQYHHVNSHHSWGPHPPFPQYPRSGPQIYQSHFAQPASGPSISQASSGSQPQYPAMNAQENYNTHAHTFLPSIPFFQRQSLPNLQRIGGTAPTQHSQNSLSGGIGDTHAARTSGLPALHPNPPTMRQASHIHQPRQDGNHHNMESIPPARPESNGPPGRASDTESLRTASRPAPGTSIGTFAAPAHRDSLDATYPRMPRVLSSSSEPSSDEESELHEQDAAMRRILDAAATAGIAPLQLPGDENVRQQQIFRGGLSARRVASRSAIASLQSVNISDLPHNEKTCCICYNDFGTETPEGINEAPLRLPRCKHVFGDHCIKKWFNENDTCPYCRDKVHSEPQFRHRGSHAVVSFIRQQQLHHNINFQAQAQALARGSQQGSMAELYEGQFNSYRRDNGSVLRAGWHGIPERRSPPGTRRRHGGIRGSPPSARPNSFTPSATMSQPYYNLPTLTASTASTASERDRISHTGSPRDQFPNPLHMSSDPFRTHWPQP